MLFLFDFKRGASQIHFYELKFGENVTEEIRNINKVCTKGSANGLKYNAGFEKSVVENLSFNMKRSRRPSVIDNDKLKIFCVSTSIDYCFRVRK